MDVNDNACFLNKRAALESIASKLAPTIRCPLQGMSEKMIAENATKPVTNPFDNCLNTGGELGKKRVILVA